MRTLKNFWKSLLRAHGTSRMCYFGKFHADSSGSGVLYKNPTSPTSSLLSFFSFSSLFNFTFLFYKAINECYHIYLLTLGKAQPTAG